MKLGEKKKLARRVWDLKDDIETGILAVDSTPGAYNLDAKFTATIDPISSENKINNMSNYNHAIWIAGIFIILEAT